VIASRRIASLAAPVWLPRSSLHSRLGLLTLLFALAGIGWWSTVERMRGMDNGPWTHLRTLGWFLAAWW
jgi:hypothetical protein